MNDVTQELIAFLNRPELDLGTSPLDVEIVQNPALLREKVATLLESAPVSLPDHTENTAVLQKRFDEVDWPRVSQELAERLRLTGAVFDEDAQQAFT